MFAATLAFVKALLNMFLDTAAKLVWGILLTVLIVVLAFTGIIIALIATLT